MSLFLSVENNYNDNDDNNNNNPENKLTGIMNEINSDKKTDLLQLKPEDLNSNNNFFSEEMIPREYFNVTSPNV